MIRKFLNTIRLIKEDPFNVWYFIQGNIRYRLYYSFPFLFSPRFKSMIEERYKLANPECMATGECIACGCDMPNLLFANKQCKAKCYPSFREQRNMRKIKDFGIPFIMTDKGNVFFKTFSQGKYWVWVCTTFNKVKGDDKLGK